MPSTGQQQLLRLTQKDQEESLLLPASQLL